MIKSIFSFAASILSFQLQAQNLVVNPDAESLPRGTGWTVISQGALACLLIPTNNIENWTMKPNGTANYPYDHTTGTSGGTVFFSGCDTYFTGPFELQQIIDVASDSAAIDAGSQLYDFNGYMQTPVSNQTDMGRFVVDFMNSANAILGTSYQSYWQSNFDGSGTAWQQHSNTRTAPTGTRKVRIKLQTQIHINQPAINVYFDDITFSKTSVVPVELISFEGYHSGSHAVLDWQLALSETFSKIEVERSTDGLHFSSIEVFDANVFGSYTDKQTMEGKYYYRLKLTKPGGSAVFSRIVMINIAKRYPISVSPNPARDVLNISGSTSPGSVALINSNGSTVLTATANSPSTQLNISHLANGLYIVRYHTAAGVINKKILVCR